jgi:hypothetical protein
MAIPRGGRTWHQGLALASGLGAALAAAPALAEPAIGLELNRLEAVTAPAEGCRIWLVLANDAAGAAPIATLRLDLVMFGAEGAIARRAAVELGPVDAGRTAVRLFDLAGLPCAALGRILVNDVLACRMAGQDRADCAALIQPASRAGIRFGL